MTRERKATKMGCSYFNGEGAYQEEYERLWEELVPMNGMASTLNGELIRAAGRLNHEFFNNGNCNACEQHFHDEEYPCGHCNGTGSVVKCDENGEEFETDCPECGGSGCYYEEMEDESTLSPMYASFLNLIEECVPDAICEVERVRDIILSNLYSSPSQFCEWNESAYSRLMDAVVCHVLTNEDEAIPGWYKRDETISV